MNNNSVNPQDKLSGKTVESSWGDSYCVTLEEIAPGSRTYVLKTQDEKYNYQSSNSAGLASTFAKVTAARYPITVNFQSSSNVRLELGGNAQGAVFQYNTSGYFRFYANGGQSPIYLYKKSGGFVYSNFTTKVDASTEIKITTPEGYSTFVSKSAVVMPDGMKGAVAEVYEGELTWNWMYEAGDVVPAETPILVKGTDDHNAFVSALTGTEPDSNCLYANTSVVNVDASSIAESATKFYTLSYNKENKNLGFYWRNATGASFDVPSMKVFLAIPSSVSAASAFFFYDDVLTGVQSVKNDDTKAQTYYNLKGQRVKANTKGIVIHNGRKIINM